MGTSIDLGEGDQRGPHPHVAGEDHIELAVVERSLRRDVHARAEVRPIRRDDGEEAPACELSVDEHAHGLRPVGRDADERAGEVAEGAPDDPRGGGDPRGDVSVDADAGGVHEDASVQLAEIDRAALRGAQESHEIASTPRVSERAREIVARAQRVQAEHRIAADEAVRDLVRGAIASGRDDEAVSVRGRLAREASRLLSCRRAHDVDADALRLEVSGHPSRDPFSGAAPGGGIDDRERAIVRERVGCAHAPAGARARRIASCSSSESW